MTVKSTAVTRRFYASQSSDKLFATALSPSDNRRLCPSGKLTAFPAPKSACGKSIARRVKSIQEQHSIPRLHIGPLKNTRSARPAATPQVAGKETERARAPGQRPANRAIRLRLEHLDRPAANNSRLREVRHRTIRRPTKLEEVKCCSL